MGPPPFLARSSERFPVAACRQHQIEEGVMQKLAFVIRINHVAEVEQMIGSKPMLAVLRQFVETVRLSCRSDDLVLHCGADESGAMLWVSDADDGAHLADRILDRVRYTVFRTDDGIEMRLTCAIGFAAHPVPEDRSEVPAWERTVELACHAVDAAMRWSDNGWIGYLGSDRPPPSAAGPGGPSAQPRWRAEFSSKRRPLRQILADRRRTATNGRGDLVH
jgi:GGDEF domain-containing protein